MSEQDLNSNSQPIILRVIGDVYNWLVPLTAINILWLLMSLTVILFPPATAGLFHVAYHVTKSQGPTVSEYLAGMRQWWWRSWLWGLIVVAFVLTAGLALVFYGASDAPIAAALFVITVLLSAFFLMVQALFWPYMMLQEKPLIRVALRNAAFTLLADPLRMIATLLLMLAVAIIGLLLVFPFVVLIPVTLAFWLTYLLVDWLKRHDLLPDR